VVLNSLGLPVPSSIYGLVYSSIKLGSVALGAKMLSKSWSSPVSLSHLSLWRSHHRQTRGEDDAANLRIVASSKSEEGWAVSGNPKIFEIGVKEIGEIVIDSGAGSR
jgi:hypothetical protein